MLTKALITGGCGFVGTNVAASLVRDGIEVLLFDNLTRVGASENLAWLRAQGSLAHIHGDVRNANDVDRAVAYFKPDAVFHLAGQVAMTSSIADPRKDFEINALGTLNVLEAVRAQVPEAVVLYSSTNKVYGDLEHLKVGEEETRYVLLDYPNGVPETISLDFHSPYGCSKGSGDQYMLDYHRIYELRTVVFRHSTIYGGRQFATFDQGWIGWFCQKAIGKDGRAEPFTISGTGKQVRDLLHSRDVVRLYRTVGENVERCVGRAFNVGGGMANSFSLIELFKFLEKQLGTELSYEKLPPRQSDQRVFVADTAAIEAASGWCPSVSREEGVREMLEWVRAPR